MKKGSVSEYRRRADSVGCVAVKRMFLFSLIAIMASCSNKPPPDYAPDPGLIASITEIRMSLYDGRVCPGNTIRASYEAVLDNGAIIPFATRYDDDYPPPLHIIFLNRQSSEATPRNDGGWSTNSDPLYSVLSGFRLNAYLRANPSLSVTQVVEPDYSCERATFAFHGQRGSRGQIGRPGPDVTVHLNVLSSPFYEELLVASVEVGQAPPFYVFADATYMPHADWLVVESRGGPGGRGVAGTNGAEGTNGADACPAGTGGAGGAGGNGGPGGAGGPGGHTTIMVPDDQPLLAGLVEAYSSSGPGGKGGPAGKGGAGGEGGKGTTSGARRCTDGTAGAAGADGAAGVDGPDGLPGSRPQVITVPADRLLRDPRIGRLLEYHYGERR
jgi:hypothetical protein